jgi:hypothetical protein
MPEEDARRRDAALAAALAVGWFVMILALDAVVPPSVVPDALLAVAPLIACSVLSPRVTAGFAAVAIVLCLASGLWNDVWHTGEQWVRFVDVVLVSGAAVVVARVRVVRTQSMERMTAIAETAQRVILPVLPHETDSLHTASRYLSAARDAVVGGDFYDCSVTEGYTRFVVGDVRGKGLGAVEQAARVIRSFRQAAAARATLTEAARDMNDYLVPFFGDEEFATALLVDLTDPGTLVLTSCGHPPAVLVHPDGTAEFLEAPPGLPLGVGETRESAHFSWSPGDRVLLYTDGLSEARDSAGDFFPVLQAANVLVDGPVDAALDRLLTDLRAHVPSGELHDDLAVLLLENTARVGARHAEPAGVGV